MAIRNIKLTITYDGLNYSGWQQQAGKRTIQGEIQQAISELTGFFTKVNGASRTDAGVSAAGQVANVVINHPIPVANLLKALNDRLPRDISIIDAAEVPMDFDSSTSAKDKHYRYSIYTARRRNALLTRNCWHRPGRLDIEAMQRAADYLIGTHDFKSFAAAADKRDNSVRTLTRCQVTGDDKWVYIDVEADRFLYNMVRNIVGTLVQMGNGRWPPEKMNEILDAKTRSAAGPTAPPEGLCLVEIRY